MRAARRLVAWSVAAAIFAAGTMVAVRAWRRDGSLPARIPIQELIENVSASAERPGALDGSPGVRLAWLRPSHNFAADGGYRRALITTPSTVFRRRLRVPADAVLRASIGVEGAGRHEEAAGIRFLASVDGRDVFSRVVNPAETRRDRRWFDERIDLGTSADSEVEIALRTEAVGRERLAGTPGWSDVRVVRESSRERQAAGPGAPNVVIVMVDTLRADRLGCYGATPSPTPTLDALAARGTLFETMVAQASWTMPSVATLLTGLYPRDHGLDGWSAGALADSIPTLAERAGLAGITTFGAAANPLMSSRTNVARGFETFVDVPRNAKTRTWGHHSEITRPFLHWAERNRAHRFLAYLHYMDVHDPYTPPAALRPPPPTGLRPEIVEGRVGGFTQKTGAPQPAKPTPAEVAYLGALYEAEIRDWDAGLAALLAGIERLGLADSTVVLVVGDHGEEFYEHGQLTHGYHVYDETLRVPLVITGPAVAPGRSASPAQGIDVFPTVAGLLGIPLPAGLPGRNLLRSNPPRPVYSETHHGLTPDGRELHLLAVRLGDWKLIHTPALQRYELYDLHADPTERTDVFATAPRADELVDLLTAWEAAAPPRPSSEDADPGLREKLKALGYVE